MSSADRSTPDDQVEHDVVEGDRVWVSTGDRAHEREAYRVEEIGPTPGRVSAVVRMEAENGDEVRTPSVQELRSYLRHCEWSVEYVPQAGDRIEHGCFHLPGELGEVYMIEEISDHPHARGEVATMVCISDRRYKDVGIPVHRITGNVNKCSHRYGRGDNQSLEPILEARE